jgi:hypothetical protein
MGINGQFVFDLRKGLVPFGFRILYNTAVIEKREFPGFSVAETSGYSLRFLKAVSLYQ